MITQQPWSYVIYLFAFIGFASVAHYAYRYQTQFLPVSIVGNQYFVSFPTNSSTTSTVKIDSINLTETNRFLYHIDRCPECVLFVLSINASNQEQLFLLLNTIPTSSQSIFYPLTMKLWYNQPFPYYTILSNDTQQMTIKVRRQWLERIEQSGIMKQLQKDSLLDYLLHSLRRQSAVEHRWSNRTKLILYYTKFFGSSYWYNGNEADVYARDLHPDACPIQANVCRVSIDREQFPVSDASLIHLRESINYDRLHKLSRRTDQRLVFFLKESPVHSPKLSRHQHGSLFNYTQTYRPDSDITGTTSRDFFWLFDRPIHSPIDPKSIMTTKIKGKLAVAIVSNCGGSSNRLKYMKELRNYTSVDLFGSCGQKCPNTPDCRQYAYSTYKFYLSFENSVCDEYVTEKFFFAVNSARIVPIVLGWARYDHYIPRSGYIDVRDFASPRELAARIEYLDRNTTAYLEYFEWRRYALPIKLPKYICELCLKLFVDEKDQRQQSLEHIDEYWNRKTQCHSFNKLKNGSWLME